MEERPVKVLLIEDNPSDARLLREMFAEAEGTPFELERATRLSAGLKQLAKGSFDVVLLDLSLPDSQGLDTFARVHALALQMPIIVLTGLDDTTVAVQAVREGAQDYLVKGRIDTALLTRAIRYAIERKRAEGALRRSELQYRTTLDSMADAIHVVDEDLRFVIFNAALKEWSRELGLETDALGREIFEVFPFLPDKVRDEYKQVFETGVTLATEERTEISGREFATETRKIPVFEDSEVARVITIVRDITLRKQAEEEIRRRAAHLEALNAVIAAAAGASDLPGLLRTALEHTLQALSLEMGAIWRAGQFVTQGIEQEEDQVRAHEAFAAGLAIAGTIAVKDWHKVAPGDPLSSVAPLIARFDVRASLAVPLLVEERRIGGVAVVSREPRSWPDDEIALVIAIGRQLGAAAERLRLFQAEREQRQLAEALQEAAAVVSSTLESDEVLDRILEQVERVVPGDAFNIMLVTDGSARVARRRGYERTKKVRQALREAYGIDELPSLVRMVETGKPIVVSDTAADPDWVPLEGRDWLCSYVGAPIRAGGVTVGFLNVNSARPGQFSTADADRLQAFANHAATAIENARLYREMLNYAEQLEQRVEERTAQIQAQYAQLEAILHSSSDGIIVTNGEGDIIRANPVADTWLSQTLSPEDSARLRETAQEMAVRAEQRPNTVLELAGLDLELKAAPITEPGGEEATAVVTVHDVSHLKALDRMKSRFVSNVSHELRTPITTIKLYAALMQQAAPDKWKNYLATLAQEADRQARLVEDILQLSRIDAGRLEMKPQPTPLNQLTQIAVANHHVLASERGLQLEHKPVEPGPVALVDPDRMTQVLSNLVTNALQYTPEGGRVIVSTDKEKAQGRVWATATVSDTGIGIPADELPHVFERFFRGEQPREMQVPGTGLGLAIAKEIVELHGGWVTVEDRADVGTTFTIWLPLAE